MATENARFVAMLVGHLERFEGYRSQFFADFYGLIVLTTHLDT